MNLSELIGQLGARRRLKPKTLSVYQTSLRQLAECLGHPPTLSDLSDETLLQFEHWLRHGRQPFTIRERVGRIRSLWRFAHDLGMIATRPTISPPPAAATERPKAWTVDELSRLVDACCSMPGIYASVPASAFWRSWVITVYATGERRGALLQLEWEWVTHSQLDIPGHVRKNGTPIVHDLPIWAVDSLEAIRRPRRLVFEWPFCDATFYHRFNWLLDRANLPSGRRNQSQKLRRTHLTLWAASGGDATARAAHSSPTVTRRHYIDQAMMPRDDPAQRLPRIG